MTPLGKGDGFGSSLYGNQGLRKGSSNQSVASSPSAASLGFLHPSPLSVPPFSSSLPAWGHGEQLPCCSRGGGPAEGPCGPAGRLQAIPGVAIASSRTASSAQGSPPSLPPQQQKMNWVGGSRSRVILKQERKKQKEYFEKKKLKSKMKVQDVSSPKSSAVSLDLLNLYMVNQISTKKDNSESVRKPVHVNISDDERRPIRRHNLELPWSSLRTRHKSHLDDLQSRLQKQVLDSRRQHLSEKAEYQNNLSHVTELGYVDSSTENEDNMARAFSACPLSSSGFQFSNHTQLSEENFNRNIMGNIWEQTYEKKQQNQAGNCFDQDPWNRKPPSQYIFRKADTVLQEVFNPFDRPENSARKNPVIIASNESENCEGIKEPIFDVVKENAELNGPQDGSGCSFLAQFEDEIQPAHNNPSKKPFNPFSNQSNPDCFFPDLDDRNQITNRNHSYDTRRVYPAINAKETPVDRHLEGIFTASEKVFLKSNNMSSTSYKKTSGLHRTHLRNCETFAYYHHDQHYSLKENVQNYSIKKRYRDKSGDLNSGKHLMFTEDKIKIENSPFTTAQEKRYKFGVSSCLQEMEMDVAPPLSSHSYSYPPRQTESYLSSSPDTFEVEDTAQRKKYLNEQSLEAHHANLFSASASRGAPKSSHTPSVGRQPNSTREESYKLQEKDSNFCATEEVNKTPRAPFQGPSHGALKREHVTHSAWAQTEASVTEGVDVGTQCGTLRLCSCGGSLPAARSPGWAPAPSTAGPAGEQPAGSRSAAGTGAFSSEAEYLSLAGPSTLEVLNYIDKMKERDQLISDQL